MTKKEFEDKLALANTIVCYAHARLEPIRRGSNLPSDDVWTALEYLEEASQKLRELQSELKRI